MKKLFFALSFIFLLFPIVVKAETTNIYLFYGDGCPHCAALEEYLNKEYKDDKDVKIYKYEVWSNKENQKTWEEVQKITEKEAKGVPYFIIGAKVYQGYNSTPSWEESVDKGIERAKTTPYIDEVGYYLKVRDHKEINYGNNDPKKEDKKQANKKEVNTKLDIPIIGKVDLKSFSLPIIAILIGLVDGFNPCAMWILIFLITMLLDYKDRKKMWILGCTFLFTSAFVYFLFMIGFLKIATFLNSIKLLRTLVATFALCFGGYNIYRYYKTRKEAGCDVVNPKQRRKIMTRIKKILASNSFLISMIGIILLAISVNLIELLCSLGLPVMFTEILSINNVKGLAKIIYIIIYVLFFLIDDLLVFIIAMKTLKITAISNKYTKYSHLIGGLIMIIIGLLMIFKYEWLMFNF